jgi:hypothetical protein
MGGTY